VSTPHLNPPQHKPETAGWERLIPGETPLSWARKKPPQSVRSAEFASDIVAEIPREEPERPADSALDLLVPRPLQTRSAWRWLRSTRADFALVGLNWLFTGTLLASLGKLFPHLRAFGTGAPGSLLGIAVLQAALITLFGYTEGLYAGDADLRRQARIVGKSVVLASAILCVADGLQRAAWEVCGLICGVGCLDFGALCAWRWHSGRRDARAKLSDDCVLRVLIVGASAVGRRVASYVRGHPQADRVVCGFLDNEKPLGNGVIGRISDLARIARTEFVDEVILAAPHDRQLTLEVLREARRLRLDVEIVPELFGCKPAEHEVERIGELPVICLHAERLPAASLVLKRFADVAGAGLSFLVLAPLLAVIALLVKLDSPGPVLYLAPRAGRKGRPFLCYKFRTMVSNADALKDGLRRNNQRSGPFFKIADDPRITRVGRFLRRYSLDELPQLWNVLRGDMSLVGPRPHPLDDLAGYEIRHLARLDVTPGMTGLWQVTARRDPSFERGIELDREYIRTWRLGLDLRILLKTFAIVVRGSGQ